MYLPPLTHHLQHNPIYQHPLITLLVIHLQAIPLLTVNQSQPVVELKPQMMPITRAMMKVTTKVSKMARMGIATAMGMMIQVITTITMKPDTKRDMKKDMMKAIVKVNRNTRKNKKKQKTNNL